MKLLLEFLEPRNLLQNYLRRYRATSHIKIRVAGFFDHAADFVRVQVDQCGTTQACLNLSCLEFEQRGDVSGQPFIRGVNRSGVGIRFQVTIAVKFLTDRYRCFIQQDTGMVGPRLSQSQQCDIQGFAIVKHLLYSGRQVLVLKRPENVDLLIHCLPHYMGTGQNQPRGYEKARSPSPLIWNGYFDCARLQ